MARILFLALGISGFLLASTVARAQLSNPLSTRVINYKTTFDNPYDINQLWLNISPMSVHAGSDNVSLGYGVMARLFVKEKLQFTTSFHSSYARGTDFMRNNAADNASIRVSPAPGRKEEVLNQVNTFSPFVALEVGALYAFKDIERKGTSRIMLTSKKSRVMEFTNVDEIAVNSRSRQVWGARLGVQNFRTTVSLNRPLEKQQLTLTSTDGPALNPYGQTVTANSISGKYRNQLYSNFQATTVYVGGGFQLIRNVAVKADKFGNLANNIIVSTFADLLIAPNPHLDDIRIAKSGGGYSTYSTQNVAMRNLGFRAGMDLSYNQDLHYSFGAEAGVRPGLQGQGFYVAARVSFPSLAFKLNRRRLANEVNSQ